MVRWGNRKRNTSKHFLIILFCAYAEYYVLQLFDHNPALFLGVRICLDDVPGSFVMSIPLHVYNEASWMLGGLARRLE